VFDPGMYLDCDACVKEERELVGDKSLEMAGGKRASARSWSR
jgi:hypothetical protein